MIEISDFGSYKYNIIMNIYVQDLCINVYVDDYLEIDVQPFCDENIV